MRAASAVDRPDGAAPGEASSEIALLVVDDDSRCLHTTPDACWLLEMTKEQVLSTTLLELVSEPERERFEHVWKAFRAGGGHAGPFRLGAASGQIDIMVTADVSPSRHLVVLSPNRTRARQDGAAGRKGARRKRKAGRFELAPSAREREVLKLLASGATDSEIAARLDLSPATVRTHVRNAKAKLGAQTRAQAVAVALKRRLIQPG